MSRMLDSYMKGISEHADEIRILDIGGVSDGRSPVFESIYDRSASSVFYTGMGVPEIQDPRGNYDHRTLKLLTRPDNPYTLPDGNVDARLVSWDARNIPYPFDSRFDEIHCHLVAQRIVRLDGADDEIPTTDEFAGELRRLSAPGAGIFLTIDTNIFFSRSGQGRKDAMEELQRSVESAGYVTDEFMVYEKCPLLPPSYSRSLWKFTLYQQFMTGLLFAHLPHSPSVYPTAPEEHAKHEFEKVRSPSSVWPHTGS